jgi:hypothetical protein
MDSTFFWVVFVVLPGVTGIVVAVTKPVEFVLWINATSERVNDHYASVARRDGFLIGVLWRSIIWGVHKLHIWTVPVEDPAVRAGLRLALFCAILAVSVLVIGALIYVAVVLTLIVVAMIVLGKLLGQESSRNRDDEDEPRRVPFARRSGRSRRAKDFWGSEYTEHLDNDGRAVGRSERKKDFFGNTYTETRDADGEVVETSRRKKDFFGNEYTEHRDAEDEKAGESRSRKDFFGNDYVEHRDPDGDETARSRPRRDFFGNDFIEHEPRD